MKKTGKNTVKKYRKYRGKQARKTGKQAHVVWCGKDSRVNG